MFAGVWGARRLLAASGLHWEALGQGDCWPVWEPEEVGCESEGWRVPGPQDVAGSGTEAAENLKTRLIQQGPEGGRSQRLWLGQGGRSGVLGVGGLCAPQRCPEMGGLGDQGSGRTNDAEGAAEARVLGWSRGAEAPSYGSVPHGPSSLLIPTDLAPLFCSQVGPIEATSFSLRAVKPQTRYCVQVAAQDLTDYGERSDWSLPAAACKPMGK